MQKCPEEKVIERLLKEVRSKDMLLEAVREEVASAHCDLEKLTLVGAVRKLVTDRKEAHERIEELEKELDTLVRKK